VERWPALRPWLVNDFVRGGVTGLGLVNLVAGVADLVPVFLTRERDDQPARRRAEREGEA
jgi:hypothetical protein